jgi:membrane-associated phospholipid phosphatase
MQRDGRDASGRRRTWFVTGVGLVALWTAWAILELGFEVLRGIGNRVGKVRDIRWAENALPGPEPTVWLQHHLYDRDLGWLDKACALVHGLWFALPFVFGVVIMVLERRRLMEFLGWILVGPYVAAIAYVAIPVRPPWMEPDVVRVLVARGVLDYAQVDPNPYSAFPSLHAGLPAIIAVFLFLRCPKLRPFAWAAAAFSVAVGFAVVYMGEHWLLDVLAGYALGPIVAVVFCSPWLRRLYDRVPGQPVARLARLNDRVFPLPRVAEPVETEPVPLPRAA